MTLSTFFIAILITLVLLVFARIFWVFIATAGAVVLATLGLGLFSLLSTIIWVIWIGGNTSGDFDNAFKLCWLYFFLAYSGVLTVWVLIVTDVIKYVGYTIKGFLRKV